MLEHFYGLTHVLSYFYIYLSGAGRGPETYPKSFYAVLLYTQVYMSENLCVQGKHMKQTARVISHLVAFTAVANVKHHIN